MLWKAAFGKGPDQQILNGGFDTGNFSGWNVIIDPNTNVTSGFPKVESFDVDGDGGANNAMRSAAWPDRHQSVWWNGST